MPVLLRRLPKRVVGLGVRRVGVVAREARGGLVQVPRAVQGRRLGAGRIITQASYACPRGRSNALAGGITRVVKRVATSTMGKRLDGGPLIRVVR